jgi:kynureninase
MMATDLDANDPLAVFRERFLIPDGITYMNGNSLGPLSRDAKERMDKVVGHEWGNELVRGWNSAGWYDLPWRLGDKIGHLIGANGGETVICDSTSVNLFKAVAAAFAMRPGRNKIVTEAGNFPTDLYILDGLRRFVGEDCVIDIRPRDEVLQAIDSDSAVVVLTHVHYVSGALFPLADITAKAHEAGALTVWDLSHSVGAVETRLNSADADFAVGCGYKHLNGGPGAPAFIFAAQRHHGEMHQPLSGWFGHARPFDFSDNYQPADSVRRLLSGTTAVLGASALEAGVDLMLEADAAAMQHKREELSSRFQNLIADRCAGHGLQLASPDKAADRGAHISYRHEQGYALMQNLIDRGVIGDFRAPDTMRFGFSPLFMRYADIDNAVDVLCEILETRSYEKSDYQGMNAVT